MKIKIKQEITKISYLISTIDWIGSHHTFLMWQYSYLLIFQKETSVSRTAD